MLHFTLMGGSEVRLKEQDNVIVTVMGGTEIKMPTLAEKIVYLRRMKKEYKGHLESATRRTNAITLMGATVAKIPTIGEEIGELLDLRESRLVSDDELLQLWHEVLEKDDLDVIEYVTIMGGAGEEYPDEEEEIASLGSLVLRGVLSGDEAEEVRKMLESEDFAGIKSSSVQEKLRNLLLPSSLYSVSSSRTAPPSHLTEK